MISMAKFRFLLLGLLMSLIYNAQAEENEYSSDYFYAREYRYQGDTLRYRILYPKGYGVEGLKFPLFIYLHGEEERGNDNLMQLKYGASLYMSEEARNYQSAVVIMPQCPKDDFWAKYDKLDDGSIVLRENPEQTKSSIIVEKLIQHFMKKENEIDVSRVYLVGKDMGAFGVLDLAARNPKLYSAVIAVSGVIEPSRMKKKKVPVRLYHGVEDPIVPIQYARDLEAVLKSNSNGSDLVEFQDTKHDDAWEMAISASDFMEWLFEKKKK